MLDAAARGVGFEVSADGAGQAAVLMRGCYRERSEESDRAVEFEAPDADDRSAQLEHDERAEISGYAAGGQLRRGEKGEYLGDVVELRGS